LWEEEYRDDNEDTWKKLLVKVHDYATRRRLEANYSKNKGEPMDVNEMGNYPYEEEGQWEEWQLGDVDAFGKSKGKGSKGKGKGKGKPGFQGQCLAAANQDILLNSAHRVRPKERGKTIGNATLVGNQDIWRGNAQKEWERLAISILEPRGKGRHGS